MRRKVVATLEERDRRLSVRILLADSHPIVRRGLRCVLEMESSFEIVGEASDGLIALDMVERLRPAIVLVDVIMPAISGLEVIRLTKLRLPRTYAVVFTMHNIKSYIHEAFHKGADGYLLKHEETHEILRAIQSVTAGERYLSAGVLPATLPTDSGDSRDYKQDTYETLTARERIVLQMAAEGTTNVAIAERLYVSARTVEIHRANAMRKLTLHNQTALIRYAIRRGLLSVD